jgi:hypothetical protein
MFFALSVDLSTLQLSLILLILLILFKIPLSVWCYDVFCVVAYLSDRVVSCFCDPIRILLIALVNTLCTVIVVDDVDVAERF